MGHSGTRIAGTARGRHSVTRSWCLETPAKRGAALIPQMGRSLTRPRPSFSLFSVAYVQAADARTTILEPRPCSLVPQANRQVGPGPCRGSRRLRVCPRWRPCGLDASAAKLLGRSESLKGSLCPGTHVRTVLPACQGVQAALGCLNGRPSS